MMMVSCVRTLSSSLVAYRKGCVPTRCSSSLCIFFIAASRDPWGSCFDAEVDRDAVLEHVEHGRAIARLLDDLTQLLFRGVSLDRELDANALVAVAHLIVDPKQTLQIDVAFDRSRD